jgi:hypothetical protein
MAATVPELIKKGFSIHSKGLSTVFKHKIDLFSSHFGSIDAFLKAKREDFEQWVFVMDNPSVKLTDKDFEKIKSFQESGFLDANLSVPQNFPQKCALYRCKNTREFNNFQINGNFKAN